MGVGRALALLATVVLLAGCGPARPPALRPATPRAPAPAPAPAAPRPLIGITEDEAALLGPTGVPLAPPLQDARAALAALHPGAVRLLVDWERLQPSATAAVDLSAPQDGCARTVGPCAPYAGLDEELRALAAAHTPAIVQLLGLPAWAVAGSEGCGMPGLSPAALAAYRALIEGIVGAARSAGTTLTALSPWNEPNSMAFLPGQRLGCSPLGAPRSPLVYAELARTAAAALGAAHSSATLLLGELAGYGRSSPRTLSVADWVRALPTDVACLSRDWSVHGYAPGGVAAVASLEAALRRRGGCTLGARVWVTETGAGAPRAGRPRPPGEAAARASCRAMAAELGALAADPQVVVVLQYTAREDPRFPVGLLSADLSRRWPAYWLWDAWGRRPAGAPAPAVPAECSP